MADSRNRTDTRKVDSIKTDSTNKYLFSIVAMVAITGLFLLFMNQSISVSDNNYVSGENEAADDTVGMVVGYAGGESEMPDVDEQGNKLCTGRVEGDSIVPDYVRGCHGTKMNIAGWALMPPAVKAYYKNKRVVYRQVPFENPAYNWPTEGGKTPRSVKGGLGVGITGGSELPDQPPMNEVEIVEVLGAPQLTRSESTLV